MGDNQVGSNSIVSIFGIKAKNKFKKTKMARVALSDSGNTKESESEVKKENNRIPSSKKWCFTLNNWTEDEWLLILSVFKSNIDNKWIIGKEVGEQGTPHLQGYINFKEKCRPLEVVKTKRIKWIKKSIKSTEQEAVDYCAKDKNYVSHGVKVSVPLVLISPLSLYPWQTEIIKIIESTPDDRTINWFWDSGGKMGKTCFSKYLVKTYGAGYLSCGKAGDIKYYCAENDCNAYIFDLPRSCEEQISYQAIEEIKNGIFFCNKYESRSVIRNCPHIFIFANFEPDTSMLSKDRWNIVNIPEYNEFYLNLLDVNKKNSELLVKLSEVSEHLDASCDFWQIRVNSGDAI